MSERHDVAKLAAATMEWDPRESSPSEEAHAKLAEHGFVVVNSVPFEGLQTDADRQAGMEDVTAVLQLGTPLKQGPDGKTFNFVRRVTVSQFGDAVGQRAQGSETLTRLNPHNDSATDPYGHTLEKLVLGSFQPAQEGGLTVLVDPIKIYHQVRDKDTEAGAMLANTGYYLNRFPRVEDGQDYYVRAPLVQIGSSGNVERVRHSTPRIREGHKMVGIPMHAAQERALTVWEAALAEPGNQIVFPLQKNQLLVVADLTTLHGRTEVTREVPGAPRTLGRQWFGQPGASRAAV